ncbi:MAG TPA: polysaccharide deacetylase family protein, partial [Prolixibacteraceae bacterium]
YHVIAPILKRKEIQTAFFINPSFVDNQSLFHRHKASLILKSISKHIAKPTELKEAEQLVKQSHPGKNLYQFLKQSVYADHALLDEIASVFGIDFNHFLANDQPYMTLVQIKKLQEDGFLIGAHGIDHREFFLSSEDEINTQISESMEFLNKKVNPPIKLFAFPFTDFKVPDSVFEKANQSKIWDLSFGTAGIKDENMPNHIQRIPMESDKITDGKQVLRTEYIWYFFKSLLGKNKVRRQ